MIKYSIGQNLKKSDCLILPLFEDKGLDKEIKDLDKELEGLISLAKEEKDFEAKTMKTSWIITGNKDLPRILLVGLGKEKELNIGLWKKIVGSFVITAQNKKVENLSVVLPSSVTKKIDVKILARETSTVIEIANYAYDEYKTDEKAKMVEIKNVEFFGEDINKQFIEGSGLGQITGQGVNFTRHLGNTPPTIMTPTFLAKEAEKLGKNNAKVKVKVLDKEEMKKLGMGCMLAVARGSKEAPKFIIVEYWGETKTKNPTILVGKGVTFDSGGISLKPGDALMEMKFDMLGAATALGAIKSVIELKLKKNVIAILPAVENMPSGDAYRPDDILTAMNGKTVEILNTDAEGRLILADALCYAAKYNPKEVIDLATLTGACMVALGIERSGVFGNQKIVDKVLQTTEITGEKLWHLPIGDEYDEAMKSEVADIKNIGGVGGRSSFGGASTAAAFLEFFTKDEKGKALYPWAHIDLASAIYASKGKPWVRVGANGAVVQTLVEYLKK